MAAALVPLRPRTGRGLSFRSRGQDRARILDGHRGEVSLGLRLSVRRPSCRRCAASAHRRRSGPWYDRQRPPLFAEALRAAKKALDPQGLLNPGVLIDP
ncbi:MAG: FAD-linked oxidase C-terminal domain-containing protein [Xanthobacteraceae bacterium]